MPKEFVPSVEQLQAIGSDARRLMVVAAAGSGKTFVLVERYLRHVLEEGLSPDQILAVTFTKKAAAGMKERIVERLRGAGRFDAAQIAETGPIQTLHSCCERILRENALEAGLDPSFEILSDRQLSEIRSACIREVIASPLDDLPEAEALVTSLAGRSQFGQKSPYAMLERAIESVVSELRGSGHDLEAIRIRHRSPDAVMQLWYDVATQEAERLAPGTTAQLAETSGAVFQERLKAAIKAAGGRVPSWAKNTPELDAEEESAAQTCGLVQLACAVWWRMDRAMQAISKLDFTELERRAVTLVTESEVTRDRLRAQFRVVMIDESQDLNPIQYRLVDALDPERLMLVGDAQQSIYGFRQAEVELFRARVARDGHMRLSKNYRSADGILQLVDELFGQIWAGAYTPMAKPKVFDLDEVSAGVDFTGTEIWRMALKDPGALGLFIQQIHHEGTPYRDICVLVRDSRGARAVEAGLSAEGVPNRIVGGSAQFYARLEVRDLANALRAVADPYDDFALLACLHSPLVGLSLDSVVLLAKSPDVVDQLGSFEPPIDADRLRLEEFRLWYEPLRKLADRLSAWETLSELMARSPLLLRLALRSDCDKVLANVRKLLALAAQEPEVGPREFAERIHAIQNLRHQEGDAPADEHEADLVTIMTIHKAKGLERKVIVLGQTDHGMKRSAKDLEVDARHGLVVTKFGQACMAHRMVTEWRQAREEAEEIRVLYVALTRAQERLCVCLTPPPRRKSFATILHEKLAHANLPGSRIREAEEAMQTPP